MLRVARCCLDAIRHSRKVHNVRFSVQSDKTRLGTCGEVRLGVRSFASGSNNKKPPQNNKQILSAPKSQPCPPPADNRWMYALAAAVVGGGVVWYLVSSNKSSDDGPAPKVVPASQRVPASAADIPKEVPYLLIGGGTASFTAFRAIKSHEPKAKVLLISNELEVPYMRPPLSKEMWFSEDPEIIERLRFKQWNGAERSIFYEPRDFYVEPSQLAETPNGGVAVCRGWQVKELKVCDNIAVLDDGTEIKYGKCLIATGARPRSLPEIEAAPKVVREKISFFKGIDDFFNLKKKLDKVGSVAIIGGGFLGSELACALAHYGQKKKIEVYQVFHEKGNMGKILPQYLSEWTKERVQEEGVNVIADSQIKGVEIQDKKLRLNLINGKSLLVDHAVVAVGSEPNTELAKSSGLEVHPTLGGFVVNAELEARTNVFVAGDVACFFDPMLGRRRIEHHDHAVVSGRLAGENMVGLHKPYTHQSMFWSDLGPKVGYEAIGLVDASLPTTGVFAKGSENDSPAAANMDEKLQVKLDSNETKSEHKPEPLKAVKKTDNSDDYGRGVVFYLNDKNRVVGILLWNLFNRISIARKVISQDTTYDDLNEVAKLFDIHEQHPN